MENSKNPGLDYLYLIKILAKREEYLKERRSELLGGVDKNILSNDFVISEIDGALSEVGFISQIIYLIGGNNEI